MWAFDTFNEMEYEHKRLRRQIESQKKTKRGDVVALPIMGLRQGWWPTRLESQVDANLTHNFPRLLNQRCFDFV